MTSRVVTFLILLFSINTLLAQIQPREVKAQDSEAEARLDDLEARLSRVGKGLEQILTGLARLLPEEQSGALVQASLALAEEAADLATEVGAESEEASKELPQDQVVAADPGAEGRVPYGGYMEMHVNHDNLNPTVLDFHRFVLTFGHKFNDRISFVGELELEHALVEGGEASGELELEQAYLDFVLNPNFSFRAGMMLTPMGIVNERHEPASFNGVERPFVDTVILPTTWFGQGAGLVGDLGKGFSFKAFGMSSLNASFFSADEGFRDGRQKGFLDHASHLAGVGRLEYAGIPNVNLGTSFWMGNTGFDFDVSGRTKIFEFDGEWSWNRLSTRGQFAITHLGDAAEMNRAIQLQSGVNPNLAEKMRGYYLEGGFQLLPLEFPHQLVAFYRYENFDTQFRMPAGFLPLKQWARSADVLGVTYFPHPDIAFKFDYNIMENRSSVVKALNRWNFGIGWWF